MPHTLYRVSGRKAAAPRSFHQAYTKTDRIDARVLARMPLVDEGLHTFTMPTAGELALKRLATQRHRLIKERTRTKGRIRSTFHWLAPGLLGKYDVTVAFLAILKRWPDLLRWVLYLAADTARRKDPQLADLDRRLMAERGRHHHQAVCGVASHLAARIWAVIRENRPYQYRDLNGNAITPQEAQRQAQDLAVDTKTRARLKNHKTNRGQDASRSRQHKAPQDNAQPSPTNTADLALEIAETT